jgi:transcription-repair coupling factor (superfamily II helicase)
MVEAALGDKLVEALANTPGALEVGGAPEGMDAAAVAAAAKLRGGVTLFVARDEGRAAQFEAAIGFFAPTLRTLRLPGWDTLPYDRISPAASVAAQRCAALTALARRDADASPLLVIATASAVAQRAPPRAKLASAAFAAVAGDEASMQELEAYLVINGYSRASTVRAPGEFAVRGGLIDVFAPATSEPLRFDFFGDTLESIRSFDPETQISKGKLAAALLTPVSEVVLDDSAVLHFRKRFGQSFGAVSDMTYDSVSARIRAQGVEQWLPFFYDILDTVFDYIGPDALVVLDALADEAIRERVETARDHYESRRNAPVTRGSVPFRAPSPELLYLSADALELTLGDRPVRRLTHFASEAARRLDLGAKPGRDFAPERQTADVNVFEAAARHIDTLSKAKRVIFAAWSDGSAERLAGVLGDHGVDAIARVQSWEQAASLPRGAHALTVLPLEHGFETGGFAFLCEQDILGDRLARTRKRRKASAVIAEAAAMSTGDLVVHQDHGVGRYEGLKTLDVAGAPHDCLDLTYAGGDKLYLPVENIELVSRYGAEDAEAQLDKLGGVAWQGRKARAKQRLRDMAEELLRIAAQRATREAEPVAAPEGLWDEFCARFPYEETEDQMAAIDDVVGDLASGKPMDRLICGDVGFGKTEVALRAAFLVAMSGKQVAVVTPTTLLCRQHYRTFSERFRGLPIKVRQLSRLVSAKESNETKAGLTAGQVEIVVGTHALLSKTVAFADLGLMIIDEEQHFGVKHKERLKDLRAEVHALTLSATPIPRTLQLALAGVREMSLITTPPIDRMAVRTYVTAFDNVTIREALLREKYRGGQSFFVAPRISDLDDVAEFLRRNVPEVTFQVAHGQMASSQLDEIMTSFDDGAFDVLLSTSIVESGLDIPRANTLVVFRADMFGLAQLYQLRGRVGRSKLRAYAYLTTAPDQTLTGAAEKRLKILSSLDNLGAGFTLASHDLDMRGGGNLLGEEQSGHIREVGVELYQSMLEEAVQALRDGKEDAVSEKSWSPQINVGAAVLIPEDYVADLNVRLALYRRLADLESDQDREAFAAELIDRFGALPAEAEQLIAVAGLKALCRRCLIAKLDAGPKGAVLSFREEGFPDPMALVRYVQEHPDDFKMRPDGKLVVQGGWPEPAQRLKATRNVLENLARIATRRAA